MVKTEYMYWLALLHSLPLGDSRTVVPNEEEIKHSRSAKVQDTEMGAKLKGMVLTFQSFSLAFDHVNYFVDMPNEIKAEGFTEDRLQLLKDISVAFRPGILTALVGVSGTRKMTLMDVLAGRKTGVYIESDISISGYPKNQETSARVSGYCEQYDIHSPHGTYYESLVYSAWLRLAPDVTDESRQMFMEEVMTLVELNSRFGLPGVNGLSTEQWKRLTVAVELVANPCIIFMDELTSGLDARAAAIVMGTDRNTVDTGRTVVCTIHQPSIDIFEAFDELLLMRRGGQVIYAGPLGHHSNQLVEYFQMLPGVTRIKDGQNPATWMLEVSSPTVEAQLGVYFATIYATSEIYRRNQELIKELSTPAPGSHYILQQRTQPFFTQCNACLWKQGLSYWRHPQYNVVQFLMPTVIRIIFGIIFWDKGQKTSRQQDLMNMLGATYAAVMFLGGTNTSSVQTVVSPLLYAFAQVAVEVIYVCIQTFIYSLLLYSMIGFVWSASNFLFYLFVFFGTCFLASLSLELKYQYGGDGITGGWYYWGSLVAWTLYGLITSQGGQNENLVEVPGAGSVPLKEFIKSYMGFEYDFLHYIAMAHVAWLFCSLLCLHAVSNFLTFNKDRCFCSSAKQFCEAVLRY
uniref:Pleiotropic drug resistance protein 2-like n=1 Tax=Tanacetum cinerariifolium TaxID=118510 RepID=A0A6L2JL45_TANCI|nr:pleiotropic drug resistance protein 2-like [Tanacetum cinerariifolium]